MPSHDPHKLRLWAQRVSSGAATVGWLGGGVGHGGGWAFRFHVRGRWGGAGRTAATAHSSGSGAGRKSAMWAGGVANSWTADGGAAAGSIHSASGGVSPDSRTMAGTVRRLRRQARSGGRASNRLLPTVPVPIPVSHARAWARPASRRPFCTARRRARAVAVWVEPLTPPAHPYRPSSIHSREVVTASGGASPSRGGTRCGCDPTATTSFVASCQAKARAPLRPRHRAHHSPPHRPHWR